MIVYADMIADIFHSGHVNFLKHASKLGDKFIVGLNSDEDAMKYKRKPIIPLKDRKEVISSCKYVDYVISPSPLVITKEFLEKYNIDLVVHAHDENDLSYNFMYKIPIELGKFKRLEYTKGISTTDIIRKCKNIDL